MVTAQALQGVRLRPVKKQGGLLPDVLQENVPAAHSDPKITKVIMDEASALVGVAGHHIPADKLGQNLDSGLEGQRKCHELKPQIFKCDDAVSPLNSPGAVDGSNFINGETLHEIKYNQEETEIYNAYITLANYASSIPWVKIPCGTEENKSDINKTSLPREVMKKISPGNKLTEQAENPDDSENPWEKDSSDCTLSGTKPKLQRRNRATEKKGDDGTSLEHHGLKGYSDSKQGIMVTKPGSPRKVPFLEKPGSPRKVCSLEKPSLPKKPDLGVLGLMSTPISREGPGVQRSSRQMAKYSSDLGQSQPDETGLPDGSTSPQNLNPEALPVNARAAADVTPPLSASSPKKQKPPILHKKPEVSMTSPKKSRPIFHSNKGYLTTGTLVNCTSMGTPQAENIFGILVETMENCKSGCPLEPQGTGSHCGPNMIMGPQELQSITEVPSCAVNQTTSETTCIFGNFKSGSLPSLVGHQPHLDDGTTHQRRLMRSLLTEVQEEEEETCGETRTQMLMTLSAAMKKNSKRRKRSRRQLLMMSATMEPTPSSSSSSSSSPSSSSPSSSEDEREEVKARLAQMRAAISQARNEDTSDSESSGVPLTQSKYSLSSALSSDSLQVELSLPDLLIQEGDEDGRQEVVHERNNEVRQDGNLNFHLSF